MSRHVGQRLLGHAVDHELLIVPEPVGLALSLQACLDPVLLAEAAHLPLERGQQSVVVEGAGTELAGELEQLLHRLVHEPLEL